MGDRAIDDLRALAARDAELAAVITQLAELDAEVAAVRSRAEEIDAFFARHPQEDTRLRKAIDAARAELDTRRRERADAERSLERARDDEARAYARHALERAADHIAVAEAALARAEEEHRALEADATELPAVVPELERRARAVAEKAGDVPLPGDGLPALIDWASHAHAALFVESRQLAAQRELVIREANELATSLLGEPTYGSTVEQVVARVAAH